MEYTRIKKRMTFKYLNFINYFKFSLHGSHSLHNHKNFGFWGEWIVVYANKAYKISHSARNPHKLGIRIAGRTGRTALRIPRPHGYKPHGYS